MTLDLGYVQAHESVQQALDLIGQQFPFNPTQTAFPTVTTLPSNPINGQIAYYLADSTNGVVWPFKYRSAASTYKWEAVGPTWSFLHVATDQTFTADSAFNDPATAGPTITMPLAGDYDYEAVANMYTTGAAVALIGLGISVAGGAPAAADIADERTIATASSPLQASTFGRLTGVTAGQTASVKYRCNTATAHTRTRSLRLRPVRVTT